MYWHLACRDYIFLIFPHFISHEHWNVFYFVHCYIPKLEQYLALIRHLINIC